MNLSSMLTNLLLALVPAVFSQIIRDIKILDFADLGLNSADRAAINLCDHLNLKGTTELQMHSDLENPKGL